MSDIEKPIQVFPGYEQLANVLQDAIDQAQAGKGHQRHANGKPFLEQPIITDGRACGLAGPAFQARKKILEALHCPYEERAVQDLLGAIVYTAAMVILKREEWQKREEANHGAEPWQAAIRGQEAQVRSQVATSAQAKDTAGDAMATFAQGRKAMDVCGYAIPPLQDGDDDPIVHVVPDRTSRNIAPTGVMIEQSEADLNRDLARADAMLEFARLQRLPEEKIIAEIEKQHRDEIAKIEREHLVHVVPDRTSRSGEVEASDWRPCPND